MSACAELTKLRGKENLTQILDTDPEWILICHMHSNIK